MAFPHGSNPQSPAPADTPTPAHKGHPSQEWKNYPKNKIAIPTIGRVVYYYHPALLDPCAAIVAACDGLMVNLGVLNHDGAGMPARGVQHVSQAAPGQVAWDWMPFQKGQAAKTEELQRELEKSLQSTQTHPLPESAAPTPNSFGGQGATGAVHQPIDDWPAKK